MRRIGTIGLALGLTLVAVASITLAKFAFPPTPMSGTRLSFCGFVTLPRGGMFLTLTDYISVQSGSLFLATIKPGAVYKIPLRDGALPGTSEIMQLTGPPSAHGVAFDMASHMGFTSRSNANSVDIFEPTQMRLVKRIQVADDVDAILFDPRSRLVYAANGDPKLATLIDPVSQAVVGTIPLGGKPEFAAFNPKTGLIYQNLKDADALAVVDVGKRAVVGRWALPGCKTPTGIALDSDRQKLFIACSGNAVMAVVDLSSHAVLQTVPVGGNPDVVNYDPGRGLIYITGRTGVLMAIQQDGVGHYVAVDTIKLNYGAHTLAVDPTTHRVYVAYISLFMPSKLAVFDVKPVELAR